MLTAVVSVAVIARKSAILYYKFVVAVAALSWGPHNSCFAWVCIHEGRSCLSQVRQDADEGK